MNVTRESVDPTEVTFNIQMDSEDEEPFITRSYHRLVSRVQIPGFRRGKAPRSIVERHLGRAALIHEALDFMVPETLDQVLKDEELEAFMEPDLEILETEPVSFKAVVPLEPVVDLGEFRAIRLEQQPVEVTDEQVEQGIEGLRNDAAPWEPVDRPVVFGDLLSINVTGTISGEEAINDQGIDFIPQQDNQLPIPGFSIYLEGMTEGQEKEFTLPIPEEHHQDQYAGQECRIHVQVLSIKEKRLPDLDDEFAKGVRDGYENMEALTTFVRQQLTETAEHASQRLLERDSLEELLKIATIKASSLLYQRELDALYEDRERAVRNQRLDMDSYLSYIGQSEEEWREQLRPQAEERLKTYLVFRKLAQEEGIDITDEEIQEEIESVLSDSGDSAETMRNAFNSENARSSIRTSLLNRKLMRRLVEIVQGSAEEPASSDADTAPEAQESEVSEEQTDPAEESMPALEESEEGAKPNGE